jgi:hypothetical protein
MFYGPDKQNPRLDNFNFYASQLRIRIEMAFGMMQRKWGILWRPMVVPIEKIKYIIEVIAHLHNCCINECIIESKSSVDPVVEANVSGRGTFEDASEKLAEYKAVLEDSPGLSYQRDQMVMRIESLGLERVTLH